MLRDAKDRFYGTDDALSKSLTEGNAPRIIKECQNSIELSGKSMFFLVDKEPPEGHDLRFDEDRVQGFLHEVPDSFAQAEDIPRAILLTGVWYQYYEIAGYGLPSHNLPPRDLVSKRDAERAIEDSEFCFDIAYSLYKHVTGWEIEW